MHSKIARDHKDHDHYADDVKDIHCFTPIKIPFGVQRPRLLFNNCKDCDLEHVSPKLNRWGSMGFTGRSG
jgi:hypothetical protein